MKNHAVVYLILMQHVIIRPLVQATDFGFRLLIFCGCGLCFFPLFLFPPLINLKNSRVKSILVPQHPLFYQASSVTSRAF
jgi:hypothetical protein